MKNKDFNNIDKIAQDALRGFEAPLDSDSWMKFQGQLEEETAIDSIAKQALSNFEVPLVANSWALFEQAHLSNQKKLYATFWLFKATEVILIAFLLLGTALYIPCSKELPVGQPIANTTKNTTQPFQSSTNSALQRVFAPQGTIEQPSNKAKVIAKHKIINQEPRSIIKARLSSNTKTTSSGVSFQQKPPSPPLVVAEAETPQEKAPAIATTNVSKESRTTPVHANKNKKTPILSTELLSSIVLKSTSLNATKTIEPITKISSTSLPKPFVCRHSIGFLSGVGSNLKTSMGKTSIGYTSGLTYGRDFSSKLSLTTSILASYKHYSRSDLITLEPDNSDNEPYQMNQNKTSHMLVISIPVELNYTFFRSDKWSTYLTTGVAMNAILSRAYTGNQEIQVNNLTVSTELNSNDFEQGLIKGGQAHKNIYGSVGVGFGAERKLGNTLRLCIQPTYYHAINKINMDRIHTFNINVGIKKVL